MYGQGGRPVQEDCEQRQAEEVPPRLPVHADGGGGPGDGPVVQGQLRVGQEVKVMTMIRSVFSFIYIQWSPLVRSAFCALKIDLTKNLTVSAL